MELPTLNLNDCLGNDEEEVRCRELAEMFVDLYAGNMKLPASFERHLASLIKQARVEIDAGVQDAIETALKERDEEWESALQSLASQGPSGD